METVATIDFYKRQTFPKQKRCCFCFSLKLGLNVWLPIEALIWILLAIAAFVYEIIFANCENLADFVDQTDDWYFYLVFGDRFYYFNDRIRTYIILINFLLILIFLTYFAFCLVLLLGINMAKKNCFLPYIIFDAFFLAFALVGCITSFVTQAIHLFRICFIFLIIKIYVELCVTSLYQDCSKKSDEYKECAIFSSAPSDQGEAAEVGEKYEDEVGEKSEFDTTAV